MIHLSVILKLMKIIFCVCSPGLFASYLDYRFQEIFLFLLDNITSRRRKVGGTHHPLKQWELGIDIGCKSQVLSWWESGNCHGTYEKGLCRRNVPSIQAVSCTVPLFGLPPPPPPLPYSFSVFSVNFSGQFRSLLGAFRIFAQWPLH